MTPRRAFVLGGAVAVLLLLCCGPTSHASSPPATPPAQSPDPTRVPRPRPVYVDSVRVGIRATPQTPAQLLIGGMIHDVETDLSCDISALGPGGLDQGAAAERTIYYLYGIEDAGAAELLASASAPGEGGPTGYGAWTYLGAFATGVGMPATIAPFVRYGDRTLGVRTDNKLLDVDSNLALTDPQATLPIPLPATTDVAILRLVAKTDPATSTGNGLLKVSREPGPGGNLNALNYEFNVIDGLDNRFDFDMYVEDGAGRIWIHWTVQPTPAWSASLILQGWVENPAEYR